MWISDKWTDYELLDCSGGERLERWGSYILVRPDPQVIWQTPRRHPDWDAPDARYIRSSAGGGRWERGDVPNKWQIRYDFASKSGGDGEILESGIYGVTSESGGDGNPLNSM